MSVDDVLAGRARWHVEECRAEAMLASLPDSCIDLIVTDPPYHKVKMDQAWDREHGSADGFVAWLGSLVQQFARVLRPNGSLYLFASSRLAARVEVEIAKSLNVLNSITWAKPTTGVPHTPGRTRKESLRAFFPWTERVVFAEHYGADNIAKGEAGYVAKCDELRGFVFEPLRAYLDGERDRAGFDRAACDAATGNQMSGHYFSRVQWALPTRENYEKLRAAFNAKTGGEYLRREYEYLRREYEELRREYEELRREYEELRRPFSVSADVPFTDVWTFPTVQAYPGKHPCEKPRAMAEHIVTASSRPDAVVADFFAGSGVFLSEAVRLGRRALGCDMDPRWAAATRENIRRPGRVRAAPAHVDHRQRDLFAPLAEAAE